MALKVTRFSLRWRAGVMKVTLAYLRMLSAEAPLSSSVFAYDGRLNRLSRLLNIRVLHV